MQDVVLSGILVQWAKDAAWALAILAVRFPLTLLLLRVLRRLLSRAGTDQVFIGFASTIANIVLLLFVVILALDRLAIDTSYLFALLAADLLALGLALQGSLSSVAAGMGLFLDQPFKSGEEVAIAGVTGYVNQIDLTSTKLRTANSVDVVVPNAAVATSTIQNPSARATRRVDLVVRIGHNDDLQQARTPLMGLLKGDARILESPQPRVTVHRWRTREGTSTCAPGWTIKTMRRPDGSLPRGSRSPSIRTASQFPLPSSMSTWMDVTARRSKKSEMLAEENRVSKPLTGR